MEELYKTGDYFCFARSSISDFQWYLAEETPFLNLPGIEYKIVKKDHLKELLNLGYKYKEKKETDLYDALGIKVQPIEQIEGE